MLLTANGAYIYIYVFVIFCCGVVWGDIFVCYAQQTVKGGKDLSPFAAYSM